jgi:myo-inositol 2-dehydrogenase/D-chiro-inositol 1-dehydrogenase
MADLRVGVVGAGLMGADHISRIQERISGAIVTAVIEPDQARAEAAAKTAEGSKVFSNIGAAIAANAMDAVIVATPGPFHFDVLVEALAANLPILCEKPLTPDAESSLQIVNAEVKAGKKLIQVGFMRRFDAGYMELREAIASNEHGGLLALRCVHRNPAVPEGYTNPMLISDSVVHEIDTVRYLTDSPIVAVEVKHLKRNTNNFAHLNEPILAFLETENGVVADVEMNVSVRFGYQVKTEAVFENAIVEIGRSAGTNVFADGQIRTKEHTTFKTRFGAAYDTEIQRWVNAVKKGTIDGPSAWDGYLAAAATEAGVKALETGERVAVSYAARPSFYN